MELILLIGTYFYGDLGAPLIGTLIGAHLLNNGVASCQKICKMQPQGVGGVYLLVQVTHLSLSHRLQFAFLSFNLKLGRAIS